MFLRLWANLIAPNVFCAPGDPLAFGSQAPELVDIETDPHRGGRRTEGEVDGTMCVTPVSLKKLKYTYI